ncbi:uncharacterized protein K460DRAFT_204288 [Cucurbitaria berberidis CBS 394.84]|uniref:DUF7820 domain-containing protein n=1 Tax=Cucurbitaria berberidis CBS 394.84 TaxID=1168544 RepID=A0A9P4L3D2_9PLEO|nr:uncharacterized protein K460DRAFT_204288 [Cucurbitaria berberidis CBS 394.84]KAF1840169.1 hypothetical protein K460DRAFT_204288 [Cucurbitaria berberidis CBS 394.84]
MQLPHRSIKSIRPLPSIYTVFPTSHDNPDSSNSSKVNSGTCLLRQIEDGIEVVPFERCNALSAPILSPDHEEKEVFVVSQKELDSSDKPLPIPPRSIWQRMFTRQRILALLGVQFVTLLTIGIALMAAKSRSSASDRSAKVRATDNDSPLIDTVVGIRRGPFAVPIQFPQQQSSACLANTNELLAWQCASDTTFQLNILPSPAGDSSSTMVTLGAPPGNGSIYHGHQIPEIPPTELTVIPDRDGSGDGPMYHFRTTYNRAVLLKEEDLTRVGKPTVQPIKQHTAFQPGESLWRCVFNETLIEGYIYVNQPAITSNETSTTNTSTTFRLPRMPYVVKLVEQRMPNGKGPSCEKVKVQQGGGLSRSSDKVMLNLSEPASELRATKSALMGAKFRTRRQTETANYCRCQWLVQ